MGEKSEDHIPKATDDQAPVAADCLVETQRRGTIAGREVRYTVTAGTMVLREETEKKGDQEGESEGAKVCEACGRAFFPRISPAVITLVRRGREMLLAHNAKFPSGRHGLIAGFVEPGETLEETVAREVMEEAGIEIGEPRYVRSQPWPFPDSLMIAFEAEYRSGEARPDGEEIDHLGWFVPENLPDIPPPGSVARYLIDRFIASLEPAGNS